MLKILKKFFDFCGKENRDKFYRSIILGLIQALFEALRIPAVAVILLGVVQGNVTGSMCIYAFLIMLVSVLGSGTMKYFSTMLQTEGGYGTCADKRIEIAEHLRFLPMGYFSANSLGTITSVTTNTMQNLESVATRVVMLVTQGLLTTTMVVVMLFFFDARVALTLLAGILLFLLVNRKMQTVSEQLSSEKIVADEKMVEQVVEYVQGITEVKTFHLTGEQSTALNQSIERSRKSNTTMELRLVPWMSLQSTVIKLITVAIGLESVLFYLSGSMSLFYCLVMIVSSFMVLTSLESAGQYSALLRVVDLSVNLANEVLNTETMNIKGEENYSGSNDIRIENISFSYENRKIIDGINLDIPEKTTTAIVGPSGGGKTTLTNLIARFWDVDEGTISLGGHNVKEYSMDELMNHFSFVFQNVYLFHDTIANNIRFSNPDASIEEVIAAAKKACCHDFIMKLPQKYDTVLGENGVSLSGGEKQRLSIARAIMKDAPVIILDEATANVDPESEAELIAAIDELTKEKTIIMIAHRLKTVRNADQIVVIDHGRIEQQGKHEELINTEGIYRNFVTEREKAVSWKL